MSRPREVLPGRTYLITRRCTQRLLLMRPDAATNEAFIYCLAIASQRYEIEVLFTVAMSNHHHTGIFDQHGNYPAFLEYFHKLFAKCQNALRRRRENFWSSEQTSVVRLVSADDVLNKLVYSVCNPVESALVDHALSWPGVSSLRSMLEGKALTANRPAHFFRHDGPMPETATLRFVRPREFNHLSDRAFASLICEKVKEREKKFRRERAANGKRPLGWRKVLQQRWTSRPKTTEPRGKLSPRVASKNKWRRIEALLENKRFLQAYIDARAALQAGIRTVLFPRGTYWLKRFAEVVCEQTPYLPA